MKAFVLGAGLGTRLRPLTAVLPKPLIPVWNKPLITYAFDHLLDAGVKEFVVNTHHLAKKFAEAFPDSTYAGAPIQFVEEKPEVLETGGGLANAAEHFQDGDFLVYNGDILTDLPIAPALEAHAQSDNLVTLVLRSTGDGRNVNFDPESGKILDLRGALGTKTEQPYQFTGIYIVRPEFLSHLKVEPSSIVPTWLKLIEKGQKIGGVVIDEGQWWDLGHRNAYLGASKAMSKGEFPSYPTHDPQPIRIHPDAEVDPTSTIDQYTVLGAGSRVEMNCRICQSIIWPEMQIGPETVLDRCVIIGRTKQFPQIITGQHVAADL